MTSTYFKRGAACLVASLAVAGAVTAVADETPSEPSEFRPANVDPAAAVQYAQAQRFAELRRARTDGDTMPADWRARISSSNGSKRWGSNPDLARRVAPGVWLVPGDGFVCVANVTPRDGALGFGCATPAAVEQGLLQPSDVNGRGEGVLTGVMVDGVESVTIVDKDGSRRQVEVDRNVYRAPVDGQTKEVRWVDAAGVERVRNVAW